MRFLRLNLAMLSFSTLLGICSMRERFGIVSVIMSIILHDISAIGISLEGLSMLRG